MNIYIYKCTHAMLFKYKLYINTSNINEYIYIYKCIHAMCNKRDNYYVLSTTFTWLPFQ